MDNPYVKSEDKDKQAEFDYIAICMQIEGISGSEYEVRPISVGLIRILLAELKYWHDRAMVKSDG